MIQAAEPLALYIHWPFCLAKCPYCDFNSHVREQIPQARFAAALRAFVPRDSSAAFRLQGAADIGSAFARGHRRNKAGHD